MISSVYPQSFSEVVLLLLLQLFLYVAVLGFTGPRSLLRPTTVPVAGVLLWILGLTTYENVPRDVLNTMIGGIASGWWVQFIVSGTLKKENFADGGPLKQKSGKQTALKKRGFLARIMFGLNKINSQRNVGTPEEAKNIPPYSRKDRGYVPSRPVFLGHTAFTIIGAFLFLE